MPHLDWYEVTVRSVHPTQIQILEALAQTSPLSPTQTTDLLEAEHVALVKRTRKKDRDELPEPPSLGAVSYHFRTLTARGMIQCVRTQAKRGALEHYYAIHPAVVASEQRAAA